MNAYHQHHRDIHEHGERLIENQRRALDNKADIAVLHMDSHDVGECLHRQFDEQEQLRNVLELYCHQFTFVPNIPSQCEEILVAGTMLNKVYIWPSGFCTGSSIGLAR